jgi:uncharacterized protein (DUF983 family)
MSGKIPTVDFNKIYIAVCPKCGHKQRHRTFNPYTACSVCHTRFKEENNDNKNTSLSK